MLLPDCLRSAAHHHLEGTVVNPDASRSFVVRDSGSLALHASAARDSSPDSAARPPAEHCAAPLVHSCRRSKSDHGRSGCRQKLEPGSARTRKTATSRSPFRTIPDVDANGNEWNNAPACVLSTVQGHGVDTRLGSCGRRRACLNQLDRSSRPNCALATPQSRAQRATACGYVDNAKALPTYPQTQQQRQPASI